MSHQPPIPDAAQSPYPLHPAPIEAVPLDTAGTSKDAQDRSPLSKSGLSSGILGVGAAVVVGAIAALGGFLFTRRQAAGTKTTRASGDDRSTRGTADRRRVAGSEPYEVTYFARKHKITAAEARDIISAAGSDRKVANTLAAERAKKAK
jgi:hypothetical protein